MPAPAKSQVARLARLSLLTLSLAGVLSSAARATTIAVYRNNTEIVIAVDSKQVVENQQGAIVGERLFCKLVVVGGAVFVASGSPVLQRRSGEVFLDAYAVARASLPGRASLAERVNTFETEMTKAIEGALRTYSNPRITEEPFLKVAVAGIERGVPTVLFREFDVVRAGGKLSVKMYPMPQCRADCGDGHWFFLGFRDSIDATVGLINPRFPQRTFGAPEAARRYVALQFGERVGPPVDIVRISREGIQKVDGKPNCPELPR